MILSSGFILCLLFHVCFLSRHRDTCPTWSTLCVSVELSSHWPTSVRRGELTLTVLVCFATLLKRCLITVLPNAKSDLGV